jgi:hypothetical protein
MAAAWPLHGRRMAAAWPPHGRRMAQEGQADTNSNPRPQLTSPLMPKTTAPASVNRAYSSRNLQAFGLWVFVGVGAGGVGGSFEATNSRRQLSRELAWHALPSSASPLPALVASA